MPPVVVEQLKATNNDRTLTPAWNTMIPIDALENHSPVNIKAEAGLTIASETVASPKLPEPADLGQNLEMKSKTFNKEEQRNIVSSTNYQTCPTCNKVYIPSLTFLSFYLIFFYLFLGHSHKCIREAHNDARSRQTRALPVLQFRKLTSQSLNITKFLINLWLLDGLSNR